MNIIVVAVVLAIYSYASYGLAILKTTTHLIWITMVGHLILVRQSIIINVIGHQESVPFFPQ